MLIVFRHHVATNISGIPGGSVQRYKTQDFAQAAYDEALDAGQVAKVIVLVTRTVLNRSA